MFKTSNVLSAVAVLLFALTSVDFVSAQEFSDWSTPVNLGPVVNAVCVPGTTNCNDERPNISKDGLSLYFSSDRPGGCGGADIYVSERASVDSPWEAPFNLDTDRLGHGLPCVINSNANESAPNLTTDGHTLFFHSFRANDNCGGGDIYYAHRKNRRDDLGWEAPVNLNRAGRDPGAPLMCGGATELKLECSSLTPCMLVNTPKTDAGPAFFHDDLTDTTMLYFTRTNLSTNLGDFDIYTSILGPDGTWGTVVYNEELSLMPHRDTRVAIRRRDGLEIILASERPGFPLGSDARKLWVSTRNSTLVPWSAPVLLPNVNSNALDGAPGLSWDGTELYFFSTRDGASAGSELYLSTRTKITGQQP
jgi:WD40-like Beta Propeller Repeat